MRSMLFLVRPLQVLLLIGGFCASVSAAEPYCAGRTSLGTVESRLLERINQERNGAGLPTLTRDPGLECIIYWHVSGMAGNHFLSHTDVNGRSSEERGRYYSGNTLLRCSEIIQWWGGAPSGDVHYDGYFNSPSHHSAYMEEGILNLGPTTHAGVAALEGTGPEGSSYEGRSGSYTAVFFCDQSVNLVIDPFTGPITHTLDVTLVGGGRVQSNPSGIDCGLDCEEVFNAGTQVDLGAVADTEFVFSAWSGDCSGSGGCSLILDQSRSVTATFEADTDNDGIGNSQDSDDDGDGIPDDVENHYGLDPLDPGDATADLDNDGDDNLTEYNKGTALDQDTVEPLVTAPPDLVVDAQGLFSQVDLGVATALDTHDGNLVALPDDPGPFAPGPHMVTWSATDMAGNAGQGTQMLSVRPRVSFLPDQWLAEGDSAVIGVMLNGDAAVYPVIVPFTVAGSADDQVDYDLQGALQLQIGQGRQASITVPLVDDGMTGEGDETLILQMGQPVNAVPGLGTLHTLTIVEGNLPPQVSLDARQPGVSAQPLTTVAVTEGPVILNTLVSDSNPGDTHSYDWTVPAGLVDIDQQAASFSFDPAGLNPGGYRFSVIVSDDALPPASGVAITDIAVVTTLPQLGSGDSDDDGIPDADEGAGDSDGDGIADYLDAIEAGNVLQGDAVDARRHLLQTMVGLRLSLGRTALVAGQGQAAVDPQTLPADNLLNIGGLYDFVVDGLPSAGDSIPVVMPQQAPVPIQPAYRLFSATTGWGDFVEDAANALFSATGSEFYCPPPGDAVYRPGLNIGDWCVQVLIQDGGANDADAQANRRVEDPGGVATRSPANGDVAPLGHRDNEVTIADALVTLRYALGLITPIPPDDLAHGDVAPLGIHGRPQPDGFLTVADALVTLRKALQLISF